MITLCGMMPDDLVQGTEECLLHYMYGEEFFGTVRQAMFTIFRFMIGDTSTVAGKSLTVALSRGYGARFQLVYGLGMIAVIFGLFNIITAIFVDSTISGLKHNDLKRKHLRQYERKFVRARLKELWQRIAEVKILRMTHSERQIAEITKQNSSGLLQRANSLAYKANRAGNRDREVYLSAVELPEDIPCESLKVSEVEFFEILDDQVVQIILSDLDVNLLDPTGLFDTFDPNGDGVVTMKEMLHAIMRLRGEPQKNDLIASWVAMRALHERMDSLQAMLSSSQQAEKQAFQPQKEEDFEDEEEDADSEEVADCDEVTDRGGGSANLKRAPRTSAMLLEEDAVMVSVKSSRCFE